MKIKFKKPNAKYSYFPGDSVDMDDKAAEELIKGGFADEVKKSDKKKEQEDESDKKEPETATLKPSEKR